MNVNSAPKVAPKTASRFPESPESHSFPRTQDFYGRDFFITKDVLIPRPETEQLIDLALSLAGKPYLPGLRPPHRELPEAPTILDVGTGSGCIAITLALELPDAKIYASDVSAPALAVAQKNAQNLGAKLTFFESDLLKKVNPPGHHAADKTATHTDASSRNNLSDAHLSDLHLAPDLILANLPYVDKTWPWLDKAALAREPSLALYAKDGGLALIKTLIEQCEARRICFLILEADPCEHKRLTAFAAAHGYVLTRTMGFALGFRHI